MESIIKTIDNDMSPRFGHTITLITHSKDNPKAVLFGGATGADGHFSINSDTFVYYLNSQTWHKLNRKVLYINHNQLVGSFQLLEQPMRLVV